MTKRGKRGVRFRWWMGALLAFLLLLALWWQQTCTLVTTEVAIESGKVSAPLTLVQLSDLHGATFGGGNRALLSRVERQEPDAVLVTGDMYTRDDERGRATALALLGELAGQYPVYFVPGEHDGEEGFLSALRQQGVTVLDYETAELTVGEETILLYGIDNQSYTGTFDLHNAFPSPPEDRFSILLAHIPNARAFFAFGADLTLCGDTHGGQVRLPLLGPAQVDGRWFPRLQGGPIYDKGPYTKGETNLFISSGRGNYPLPLRLFNRPEVVRITVRPAK